jgi:hypothetical protein
MTVQSIAKEKMMSEQQPVENSVVKKTQSIERRMVPTHSLVPNDLNPNEMSEAEFNLLCDNVDKMGLTDPILVRPLGADQYKIVGGHHRWEAAKLYGMEEVPVTIITDPSFDEDQANFQMVRMNVIHGTMSPKKFFDLYKSLAPKYQHDILSEAFGFTRQEEMDKMISKMASSLPKPAQEKFKKAAKEVKTIEGLSKLLNSMFQKHGNTLPYGYMVVDFGGKESMWLRLDQDTKKALHKMCERCVTENRTIDSLLGGLLQMMASGVLESTVQKLINHSTPVMIPQGTTIPTEDMVASGAL